MLYYKAFVLTATNVSLEMNKDIKIDCLQTSTDEQAKIIKMPIEYDYVSLYNPQSGFAAFLIPPVLMLIIQQTLFLGIGVRREDCILLFVFLSVPLLFLSGILWPGAAVPKFWLYVSWLFPSTFGMNGYVRLQGMGASLSDISYELKGLWIQTGVYFCIACLLYRRQLGKLLRRVKTVD